MILIHFPYLEIGGVPLIPMSRIKEAGFDGVEIHFAGHRNKKSVQGAIAQAKGLGLAITLHQGWSLEENPTHFTNKVLNGIGCLPPAGYSLEDHLLPMAEELPTVIYADRHNEIGGRSNWWLQTVSVFAADLSYKVSYADFLRTVKEQNRNVVFDTQHVLEFKLGKKGVEELRGVSLLERLLEGWDELHENVKEIHLVDFKPDRGHTLGRNAPLGSGNLPLSFFANEVKRTNWSGIITPEASPLSLMRASVETLRGIRNLVSGYFLKDFTKK